MAYGYGFPTCRPVSGALSLEGPCLNLFKARMNSHYFIGVHTPWGPHVRFLLGEMEVKCTRIFQFKKITFAGIFKSFYRNDINVTLPKRNLFSAIGVQNTPEKKINGLTVKVNNGKIRIFGTYIF